MLISLLGPVLAMTTALATLPVHLFINVPGWEPYRVFLQNILIFLGNLLNSGGLAIIAFTLIIKTLMLPLTIKSTKSSKAMQELQPKIKELQKKYGKDRQRISQETMALYQAHGVNPMAGCLPMFIQLPIFWGLYYAIRHVSEGNVEVFSNGFLWLHSLARADPYKILPILAGIFQFIQARMMRPAGQAGQATDPQQKMMNQMMQYMPLMVVLFGWNFASGPVIYWVTQAFYSIVQQWLITGWGGMLDWFPWLPDLPEHRRLGYHPPRNLDDVVVVSGPGAVKKGGIQGWLMAKVEAANQHQAAIKEQQQETAAKRTGGRSRPAKAANGQADEPAAADGEPVIDEAATRPARHSSSYQDRVNAATRFGGQSKRPPANGTTAPEAAPEIASSGGAPNPIPTRKGKRKRG